MKHSLLIPLLGMTLFAQSAIAQESRIHDIGVAIQSRPSPYDTTELSSLAQAMGMMTLSEAVGHNGTASRDLMATFESRLIRAQEEWIQFQSLSNSNRSTAAIEAFLQLESESIWNDEARLAFYEFHQRLARMRPERRQTHLIKAAISLNHFKYSKNSLAPSVPVELAEMESRITVRWVSFSEVPNEIAGLFVDGHWYDRSQGRFPLIYEAAGGDSLEVRLTGISNSHWPIENSVRPLTKDLELSTRLKVSRPLMTDSSACIASFNFTSRVGRLIAVDKEECRATLLQGGLNEGTQSEATTLGKKFGVQQIDPDPFRDQKPLEPLPKIKPWMWATLGGIALTALIISHNRGRQGETAAVQPVHRAGW